MKRPHRMSRSRTRAADSRHSGLLLALGLVVGITSLSGCGVAAQSQNGPSPSAQVTAHDVTLSWSPSISVGVVGYRVYRSTQSGGFYTLLTSTLVPGTSFVDSAVAKGQTYYYVVTAVDAQSRESAFSAEVFATIPSS